MMETEDKKTTPTVAKGKSVAAVPKEKPVKATPAKTKSAPKEPKTKTGPTITRMQAAARAIKNRKSETTIKGLVTAADKIATRHGHASNPKESLWSIKVALPVLVEFGLVTVDGNTVRPKS